MTGNDYVVSAIGGIEIPNRHIARLKAARGERCCQCSTTDIGNKRDRCRIRTGNRHVVYVAVVIQIAGRNRDRCDVRRIKGHHGLGE